MAELGLLGFDGYEFAVANLPRSRQFYVQHLDFAEVQRASPELVARTGQEAILFEAGDVRVAVAAPVRASAPLARYLSRHPAGVTVLAFQVANLDHARNVLSGRGATFLAEPVDTAADGGRYRACEIATPLGEVIFRFVEREEFPLYAPGFELLPSAEPMNRLGFRAIDHVTCNAVTMMPIVLWYQEVLGFDHYWDIQFHTADMVKKGLRGSGFQSVVMWDPESQIKLATNEPLRPFFLDSQINTFVEQNRGPGVQHIALRVPMIIPVVDELAQLGVEFLEMPNAYYERLPARLARLNISRVKEPLEELARLGILVDGADDRYLLQIFLREASGAHRDPQAGPFLYELIQRTGYNGFGEGTFRALFEVIEQDQFLAYQSPMG